MQSWYQMKFYSPQCAFWISSPAVQSAGETSGYLNSCGSMISSRWGHQPCGGGAPTYIFAKFSQKLYEIERIWRKYHSANALFLNRIIVEICECIDQLFSPKKSIRWNRTVSKLFAVPGSSGAPALFCDTMRDCPVCTDKYHVLAAGTFQYAIKCSMLSP